MAKRSLEKSELSCSLGLPRIVKSQPGCSHKMISNGKRPTKKHIADNQRNADQLPRFDQECHKVQDEAESERVSFSTSTRRDKHLIRANNSNESHKGQQIIVNGQRPTQTSPQLVDHIVKSQKKVRKLSQNAYQLSSCYLNNTALIHPRKSDHVASEIKTRQVQMNAKAFVDQLFVERMLIRKKNMVCSDSKPFSSALQDLFVENLQKNKTSFTEKSPDKIVIMKPATSKNRRSENVTCHCSSLQPHRKSVERVPKAKPGSFSFRQVKKKLKHAFVGTGDEPNRLPVDQKEKFEKKHLESSTLPDVNIVCRKSDVSSAKVHKKQEVNVTLEAKRHLSARFKNVKDVETVTCKRSPKTLRHILLSPEDSQYWCEMPNERRTSLEVISSSNFKEHEGGHKVIKMKSNKKVAHTGDSISENDTFSTSEYQSPTCSINQLEAADRSKYREEHQSPVSVLEPFFAEDDNSPTSITSQSGKQPLQTQQLDFEECSFESHPLVSSNTCMDAQDYIFCYVHSVFQASCLDWDQLSELTSQPEEFLHASLFDEVDFLPSSDYFFDCRLLFDHMNEALLDLHQCYFSSTSRPALIKPEIRSKPLERLVLDEVLRESDFYLLPRTVSRTLDQQVSKDVASSRSWVKLLQETEELVYDVSEDILEAWILDVILELSA